WQKSQTVEYEYSLVQNWSPNEFNQFLKERFIENWETLKKFDFEKHGVAGNEL
ncbi:32201_t:CDS:1, partial [Gigaspora margarita]